MILKMLETADVRRGSVCSVAYLLDKLEPAEAGELREALRSDYRTSDIARVLNQLGHKITKNTLGRHRRGECSCQTEAV